jgi:lysophospholipase L1-like esterase/Rieske Fe-S protein
VQFQVDETSSEATSLMIRGQAIDNAPTFAGGVVGDITSRAVTASGISWNPPAWNTVGAAGSEQQTPDIKNVIQEIVDRPGWSSGNSLAIILTGTGKRVAESFDGSQSGAPLLHVEYGTGLQLVNYYCDGDGDGFRSLIVSGTCTGSGCEPSGCQSVAGNDCNDGNVAINPGAPELCDGLDNDCNVATADGSGEVAPSNSNQQGVCSGSSQSCSGGAWADNYLYVTNYETVEGSCADGLDNDCDGSSDDADLDCTAVLAIFDIQVSASSDDAEETVSTGQMLVKNSDLELAFDGTPQAVGLRFTDIDIPQGALIQNAYVQFQVDETSSEATSLMIRGQEIDNAPTFAGGVVGDITSRAVTASGIFWNPPAWNTVGAAGSEQQTPDIKNVIQEIVNLPGWSNGNSLAIILTGTGKRVAESFDGSQSGAPLLHVEYIAGAASVCAGNCYVAMGDSITYGISDDIAADGIGYTPILSDLLGGSSTIANEGVPGDKSIDGISDVSAILIRNPNASLFLVQYGTNDAQISSPLPSGLGCSGAACSGTFKGNMLQIIDAINNEGKEVALAKIPIALAGCTTCSYYTDPSVGQKNIIIQGYNEVIDELVNDPANNIVVIPPDFYAYFSEFDSVTGRFRYEDEYGDWVHPNGIGYQSMADLWFQVLTQ